MCITQSDGSGFPRTRTVLQKVSPQCLMRVPPVHKPFRNCASTFSAESKQVMSGSRLPVALIFLLSTVVDVRGDHPEKTSDPSRSAKTNKSLPGTREYEWFKFASPPDWLMTQAIRPVRKEPGGRILTSPLSRKMRVRFRKGCRHTPQPSNQSTSRLPPATA